MIKNIWKPIGQLYFNVFLNPLKFNGTLVNQLKTPTYYIENEEETLEKYKDMFLYTNKHLSYAIFYDGEYVYMIK